MQSEKRNNKTRYLLLASVILVCVMVWQHFPEQLQAVYFNTFYIHFSSVLRLLFGFIPFSVGDILYVIAGCWIIVKLYKVAQLTLRRQISWKHFKVLLFKSLLIAISFLVIFKVVWGLNYFRLKIAEQLPVENTMYTTAELVTLVDSLISQSNKQHYFLTGNDTLESNIDWNNGTGYDKAYMAYSFLKIDLLTIKCPHKSIKSSLFTPLINYSGVSGYYNPFTGEAQINSAIPKLSMPFTVCHEMAHQAGYAAEDEANFIAYLVCTANPDISFQYSGNISALMYAARELRLRDPELFKRSYGNLAVGVKKDIHAIYEYWRSISKTLSYVLDIYYNDYLKLNNQHSGIKSYNEMTALLIAYRKLTGNKSTR
jgi:hypothetical protein